MDWPAFISTIIGAGVSILTSLAVFGFTSWLEARRKKAEEKKRSAFLAFSGFQKLVRFVNEVKNIDLYIDKAFKDAVEVGLEEAEPFQKIQQLLGAKVAIEPVKIEEMFFLIDLKLSHVMAEIDIMYRRVLNTEAVVAQFNSMKLEFSNFVEVKMQRIQPGEGTRVAFDLIGNDAKLAQLKGGAMNNLIGQLLEHLERDCIEAKRLAEVFLNAAQTYFDVDFPKVKITWEF